MSGMKQRMNKERARENIKKLKEAVEQYNKMIVPPQKECSVYIGEDTLYLNDEMLESLDIAIESLDQEKNIKDCIIELQAFVLTMKDLRDTGYIQESIYNVFSKKIKEIIERLEPYERKE